MIVSNALKFFVKREAFPCSQINVPANHGTSNQQHRGCNIRMIISCGTKHVMQKQMFHMKPFYLFPVTLFHMKNNFSRLGVLRFASVSEQGNLSATHVRGGTCAKMPCKITSPWHLHQKHFFVLS